MIKVFKTKYIPSQMQLITANDVFFNKYTAPILDNKACFIVSKIDNTDMIDRFSVLSRFDGAKLNVDKLSTGCKTALNVMYHPDKVFDVKECGDNALDIIYSFDFGNICCEYPLISDYMEKVLAIDKNERVIDDYDELKEWWQNEE